MKKLLALLTAMIMIVALAVPVFADVQLDPPTNTDFDYGTNGTEADGTQTALKKYLVVEKDTVNPEVTFTYTMTAAGNVQAGEILYPATSTPATPETWSYDGVDYDDEQDAIDAAIADGGTAADVTHNPAVAASTTLPVYAGVGSPTVTPVTFGAGTVTTPGASDKPIKDTEKLWAEQDINISFSGIKFPKPGVYRYILEEQTVASPGGILYDVEAPDSATTLGMKRTIDVYVQDTGVVVPATPGTADELYTQQDFDDYVAQNGSDPTWAVGDVKTPGTPAKPAGSELAIMGYVSYLGEITEAPEQQYTPNGFPQESPYANGVVGGSGIDTKSNQYINQIKTNTFTVEKVIGGNQGDKESTWTITVTFNDLPANVTPKYALIKDQGQDVASVTYSDYTPGSPLTIGHKDKFKFIGIPEGVTYTITETDANKEGYVTTYENETYKFKIDSDVEDKDDAVVNNNRIGVIPTGVAMGIIGGIVIIGAAIAYFVVRRRLASR